MMFSPFKSRPRLWSQTCPLSAPVIPITHPFRKEREKDGAPAHVILSGKGGPPAGGTREDRSDSFPTQGKSHCPRKFWRRVAHPFYP
jgi:hypothetical protein